MARSIIYEGTFFFDNVRYTLYPPVYSLLISPPYLLPSMKAIFLAIKVLNAFIISLSLFPLWLLAREFLTEKKALIIAAISSLAVPFVGFTPYILSENLFYPLALFQVYFTYKAFKTMELKWHLLAGAFLGFSIVVRINAFILVITYLFLAAAKFYAVKEKKRFLKFPIAFFLPLIIVALPWFLRNILHFGFSLQAILGRYVAEVPGVGHSTTLFSQVYWILLYCGYALFATAILFLPLTVVALLKTKNKNFRLLLIISLISLAGFILLAGIHSGAFPDWSDSRPIGRYIAQAFPLIILCGLIAVDKNIHKVLNLKMCLPFFILTIITLPLVQFKLYPLNNMSLAFFGAISYLSIFLALIIYLAAPCLLLLIRRISYKQIVLYAFAFFLIANIVNASIIYYSSKEVWGVKDEAMIGRWIDEHIETSSVIGVPSVEHSFCNIGEEKKPSILYSGMYFKNKIVCISGTESYDYVLTSEERGQAPIVSFGKLRLYGKQS
ncbi:MAG: glycosyltransferase family 39 protein [Candidatus Woesearchaeota archaeon]